MAQELQPGFLTANSVLFHRARLLTQSGYMSSVLTGRALFLVYCLGDFNLKGCTRVPWEPHVCPPIFRCRHSHKTYGFCPMNPSSYRNCTMRQMQRVNKMAQNTERSCSGDSHGSSEMLKRVCPPDSVLSPQTSALSGSHWAPRERLASTTWQHSLRPGWFLVASGRLPGITLCV